MERICRAMVATAAAVSLLLAAGCGGRADSGLTSEQKHESTRLGEIAKKTDGEWSKLSPDDRNFLVNELSHGSEQSARMLLLSAAGKIGGGRPGVPQRPPSRP